jgi:hypothetical protein
MKRQALNQDHKVGKPQAGGHREAAKEGLQARKAAKLGRPQSGRTRSRQGDRPRERPCAERSSTSWQDLQLRVNMHGKILNTMERPSTRMDRNRNPQGLRSMTFERKHDRPRRRHGVVKITLFTRFGTPPRQRAPREQQRTYPTL